MYIDLVMALNFAVDLLLILGANFLAGFPATLPRAIAASIVGGIYAGLCLLPGFSFLGSLLWRLIVLVCMSMIAFGWNRSAIRRGILFLFLSMALGGIALGLGNGGIPTLLGASAVVTLLCALGFRTNAGKQQYAVIRLGLNGKKHRVTALYDTGNTLKDPLTGKQVILVGPEVARALLGLDESQLMDPLGAVGCRSGLRLIPYRSIGQPNGMLLGSKMDEIYIDGVRRDAVVAFLPQSLGNGMYEALAGGI